MHIIKKNFFKWKNILKILNFDITYLSSYRFLEIISIKMGYDKIKTMQIQYMIEIALLDYNYLKFSTFIIVISANLIVNKSKEVIILKLYGNRNLDLTYE